MPLHPIRADSTTVVRGVTGRRRRWRGVVAALVGLVGLALPLAACSPAPGPGQTGGLAVVASTNVWGDVVNQVGGSLVSVTSFISSPSVDPHSYEANARNQLALKKAVLVVANGGGYDDFVDTMVASLDSPPPVLHAFTIAATDEDNEHVWYDLQTVRDVADEVATRLSEIDPADAATFAANAKAFGAQIADLEQQVADIKQKAAGTPVAITEPLPLYLIDAAGLDNLTPPEFSAAIENETDVPPAALADTLALFSGHRVRALVYNSQTTGPQTQSVLAAAKSAGIAVVSVTETLPSGVGYVEWMQRTVTSLREAVVT
ncbi:MAG TPA: zinc ABC transporter substrate-binding protein [Cellulomonas sp.]